MRAAALLALTALAGSCNPFGPYYDDVCSKYPGQTCIALGLGCADDIDVDQLELQSATPGLLPGGDVRAPMPAAPLRLPAIVAILPDASFAGGAFTINVTAYLNGNKVIFAFPVQGMVAAGAHVKINNDPGIPFCLRDQVNTPCTNCPGCCDNGACVQMSMGCSTMGTVCANLGAAAGGFQCTPCGGVDQPCCQGAKCTGGCCNTQNNGGTCVAVDSFCFAGSGTVFFCLPTSSGPLACQHCGGRDEACCPPGDGGSTRTCANNSLCCDPARQICEPPDGSTCP